MIKLLLSGTLGFFRFLWIAPNLFSTSIEVFVRRRFGERYLTWSSLMKSYFGVLFGMWLIRVYLWIFKPGWAFYSIRSERVQSIFLSAFMFACIWHKIVIWWRVYCGQQWQSDSPGEPWLIWKLIELPEWLLFRFVEPLLVIGTAILTVYFPIDGLLTMWLFASGASLFVKRQILYFEERGIILNLVDAGVQSGRIRTVLTGEKSTGSNSAYVVKSAPTSPPAKPTRPNVPRPDETIRSALPDDGIETFVVTVPKR